MKRPKFNTTQQVEDFYNRKSARRVITGLGIMLTGVSTFLYAPDLLEGRYPAIEKNPRVLHYLQAEDNLTRLRKMIRDLPPPNNFTNYPPKIQEHLTSAFEREADQRRHLESAVDIAQQELLSIEDKKEVRDYQYKTAMANKNRLKNKLALGFLGAIAGIWGFCRMFSDPYAQERKKALRSLEP